MKKAGLRPKLQVQEKDKWRNVNIPTNKRTEYNTIHDKYQTATCFSTGVPSSEILLEQRNTSPAR
jgi:hypothetical protein